MIPLTGWKVKNDSRTPGPKLTYCWWKTSCTTWNVQNLVNNGISYLSTDAGFLPSTVAPEILGLEDDFPFGKASWQVLSWHFEWQIQSWVDVHGMMQSSPNDYWILTSDLNSLETEASKLLKVLFNIYIIISLKSFCTGFQLHMAHGRKGWNDLETYQASGWFSFRKKTRPQSQMSNIFFEMFERFPGISPQKNSGFVSICTQGSCQFAGTQKDCLIADAQGNNQYRFMLLFSRISRTVIFRGNLCRLYLDNRGSSSWTTCRVQLPCMPCKANHLMESFAHLPSCGVSSFCWGQKKRWHENMFVHTLVVDVVASFGDLIGSRGESVSPLTCPNVGEWMRMKYEGFAPFGAAVGWCSLKTHRRFGPKRWAIWHSGWPSMSMHTTQEWAQSAHHNMHLGMFQRDGSWCVVIRHATTGLARGRKGQGCETVSLQSGQLKDVFYLCLHHFAPVFTSSGFSRIHLRWFFGCASHLHVSVPSWTIHGITLKTHMNQPWRRAVVGAPCRAVSGPPFRGSLGSWRGSKRSEAIARRWVNRINPAEHMRRWCPRLGAGRSQRLVGWLFPRFFCWIPGGTRKTPH